MSAKRSLLNQASLLVKQGMGSVLLQNTETEYVNGTMPDTKTAQEFVNESNEGLRYLSKIESSISPRRQMLLNKARQREGGYRTRHRSRRHRSRRHRTRRR